MFIENLSRFSTDMGASHRLLVFTRERSSRVERRDWGLMVEFCPYMTELASMPLGMGYCRRFFQLLDWADVLHLHFPFPLQDVLFLLARMVRRLPPTIVTYHSDVVRQRWLGALYGRLARFFLRRVDRVVATSPQYAGSSEVLRRLDRVDVVPLGISADAYPAVERTLRDGFKARLGEGFFLFLGALRYYKGLTTLVEAARETGCPVVIAGDGEMAGQLKSLARDLPNVHFVHDVSERDKMALLSLAGVFVFPSHLRSEAFGISLLEAQMMHLPLITCEIGTGTSHVNRSEVTGLVIPPNDAGALADAMGRLSRNPALCKQMGEAGHGRFSELFTAEAMAAEYSGHYRHLLS